MSEPRNWLAARFAEARIALMLLTRIPAGSVAEPVPVMASSAWAFPLVGAIAGGVGAIAFAAGVAINLPPAMASLVAVAAVVAATGGMHEDGLADLADGLGGGRDCAGKLAIMRDSSIGSYGALALILALGLRAAAMMTLADAALVAGGMIALAMASRAAMAIALFLMPPARDEGLGKSAAGVGMMPAAFAAAVALPGLAFLVGNGLAVAIAMAVTGVLLGVLAWRQIGGQTGDVLGAMQQVTEIAGWFAIVALNT